VVEKYDGSLKAEHSTGRNIAPYVELEWGAEAYGLMQQIKGLLDPDGLLNPGVILNDDPEIHIKNFKSMTAVDPLVDRCIECGFCEPVCPSRELTLTPRQRIVALRERARLQSAGHALSESRLMQDFDYAGDETCAGDGLCATRCPVGIDTGKMIKVLRAQKRGPVSKKLAGFVDAHMAGATAATRLGLRAMHATGRAVGEVPLERLTAGIRRISGGRVPDWHRWMPRAGDNRSILSSSKKTNVHISKRCVYFSACLTRSMGTASCDSESRDLIEVMHSLLHKAGYEVVIPSNVDAQCCGMPFSSKGLNDSAAVAVRRLEDVLWQASEGGRLPVLCDTSPCTARMQEQFEKQLKIYEPVGFIRAFLLPELERVAQLDSIALHITCSARKMGLEEDFIAVAGSCAKSVFLPEEEGCCGFAGDKGFYTPELNASATSRLKQQLPEGCDQGYSNSRTCEIGLSRHSGIPYRSIAYLVDRCYAARGAGDR